MALDRRRRKELAERPVWLFSSGPLGTDLVDKDGKNVLQASRPKEFDELTKLLHPRGEQVFFGAYDPDASPVGLGERLVQHMPPAGAVAAAPERPWRNACPVYSLAALPATVRLLAGVWVISIRRACAFGAAGMVTRRTPSA
jgi:hypothetical protein